jgi:hypothetical protein
MKPYDAARTLKTLWDDTSKYTPVAHTYENAESYAASALEWHFQILCGFDNILGED